MDKCQKLYDMICALSGRMELSDPDILLIQSVLKGGGGDPGHPADLRIGQLIHVDPNLQ